MNGSAALKIDNQQPLQFVIVRSPVWGLVPSPLARRMAVGDCHTAQIIEREFWRIWVPVSVKGCANGSGNWLGSKRGLWFE
jgi:hypothetical protein